ncbi:hypothetical protein [Profundibacter sp.]|uniref:hypothetical protein n=1 Tax=Profundibacter sp. TaxID=3101071 RepID=UPI003D10A8C4
MEFPKTIKSFVLHDMRGKWTYKGKELRSAHYIRVGSRMSLFINTESDIDGNLSYAIRLRDSTITGIATLKEAIHVVETVIDENEDFISQYTMLVE